MSDAVNETAKWAREALAKQEREAQGAGLVELIPFVFSATKTHLVKIETQPPPMEVKAYPGWRLRVDEFGMLYHEPDSE